MTNLQLSNLDHFQTGDNDRISGKGHGNHISGLVVKGDVIYTAGIDDSVKSIGK